MTVFFWTFVAILLVTSFVLGRTKATLIGSGAVGRLHSQPVYHGWFVMLSAALPALCVLTLWIIGEPIILRSMTLGALSSEVAHPDQNLNIMYLQIQNVARGALPASALDETVHLAVDSYTSAQATIRYVFGPLLVIAMVSSLLFARSKITLTFPARHAVEKIFRAFLFLSSTIAILTTVGIVSSLIVESVRFFQLVSPIEFLFGTKWSPQMAIRADQVASEGAFGAIPLFVGTGLIAFIAMCVAGPLGLFSAIYLSEYASSRVRSSAKPLLEILAGIPTVVYGFLAALSVAPWIRDVGQSLGLSVSSESALAAGVIMGIMIIPFISSLSDDVIHAVPQTLRDGSYALGATKAETIKRVVLPAALPGVVGAFLLAISRAIGETMIVVMAAGLIANLTLNPLTNVTTVTVQIVTTLVGDQEFDSAKTLSVFALGLLLFCVTLVLNVIALRIVKRYREKYE